MTKRPAGKVTIFDYDRVLLADELSPTFHRLSEATRLILLSCLRPTRWETRWESQEATEITQETLDNWYAVACDELLVDIMLDFRQNPDNLCLLQYSEDGGGTWVDMFNYDLCRASSGGGMTINIAYDIDMDILIENYVDEPSDIDCDNVYYDSSGDDDYRDAAKCLALKIMIDTICESLADDRENAKKRNAFITTVMAVVATGMASGVLGAVNVALGLMTGGLALIVGGAITAAVAIAVSQSLIDDVGEDDLRNQTLRDMVACCAYDQLSGFTDWQTSGQEEFQTALNAPSCQFTNPSPVNSIRKICRAAFQTNEMYYIWLKLIHELYDYAHDGLLTGNDCEDCGNDWYLDMDFALQGWEFVGDGPNLGHWDESEGVLQADLSGGTWRVYGQVGLTGQSATITQIKATFTLSGQSSQNYWDKGWAVRYVTQPNTEPTREYVNGTQITSPGPGQYVDLTEGVLDGSWHYQIRVLFADEYDFVISRFRIYGTGVKPNDDAVYL